MDRTRRRSWLLGALLPLALAMGCAPAATGAEAEGLRLEPSVRRLGDEPRLFTREDQGARALELYLPQPEGKAVVVRSSCASPDDVQRAFGITRLELAELLSDDDDLALRDLAYEGWTFPCAPQKPQRVAYAADDETWRVTVTGSAKNDAGAAPDGLVLSIPKACARLLEHFQVSARLQEQRGQEPPPVLAPDLTLRCVARPASGAASSAWTADIVQAGRERRALVMVSNGVSAVYLHRIDQLSPGTPEQDQRVLARAASLFRIAPAREPPTRMPVAAPRIAFDACAEECVGFAPSHLIAAPDASRLTCPDGSAPGASVACASQPFALEEQRTVSGERVHALMQGDARSVLRTFAACDATVRLDTPGNPTADTWARALGLAVRRTAIDLVERGRTRYLDPSSDDVTPCVRDTGCTVTLAANAEISDSSVLRAIGDRCWQGERALTLRLSGSASALNALTLSSPGRCVNGASGSASTSLLPCSIETVRVTGATSAGATIQAPPRLCAGVPCTTETPVISARGPLSVELEDLRIVAEPPAAASGSAAPAAPERPSNRLAVEVSSGATLYLRRTEIGVADASAPVKAQLFTGVRASDAAVYAWQSSVRAFSTALDVRRSKLVMMSSRTGEPVELRALVGERSYKELVHYTGAPMAQANGFVGLRLEGSGARAFLGKVNVTAPVGVLYLGPGGGSGDLTAIDARIEWNARCTAKAFGAESHALELAGKGELRFSAVDVLGVGSLLRCYPSVTASAVFEGSTFDQIAQRLDAGSCSVKTEFPIVPEACAR